MMHLQLQRSVAEGAATFHAFAASYAKFLVDSVFKERIFYEFPLEGIGRAELVLGGSIKGFSPRLEISPAEVAIAAHGKGMGALDGRRAHNAIGGATSALYAFGWVDLPDHLPGFQCSRQVTVFIFAAPAAVKTVGTGILIARTEYQGSAEQSQGRKYPSTY